MKINDENFAEKSCTNADLKMKQEATGSQVGGKIEYEVNVQNTCTCVFVDVILDCGGFQTQEPIDPSILKQDGQDCTLNNGNSIAPNSTLTFKYAADQIFNFTIKNAQIACS